MIAIQKKKLNYRRNPIINNYPKQKELLDCIENFCIVEATVKAGKTSGCIVWLFEQALQGRNGYNFWWVAPVYSQAEIAFTRLKRYINDPSIIKCNEADLTIKLINGTVIWFKTAEKPDNLYGEDVHAAVLDEATRMKETAWFAVFTTLTATSGKCKIIGNVQGINNWAYKLAREAEQGKEGWHYLKITADDAVKAKCYPQERLDRARNTLPKGVFDELYYGIPNQNAFNRFCYSFDEKKHVGITPDINRNFPVYLSFDFNRNPITCAVIQNYDSRIIVNELIKLENSDIYKLCDVIRTKYFNCDLIITGDASGQNKSAMVKDNLNYYIIIKELLNIPPSRIKVPLSNPSLAENQTLVNGILEHYPVTIDVNKAQALIFDCKFAEMLADGTIKKGDRNDPAQQCDSIDCFRYYLNTFMKDYLKIMR